jgi:hypothetical protein
MRKLQVYSVSAIACALIVIGSSCARAEPPQSMAYYEPNTPFVVCDTRDQIMQVVDAVRTNKLKAKLTEFGKQIDANREPVCAYGDIGPIVFGASEHLGVVIDKERVLDVWVSHVRNPRGESYLIWSEVGKETSV